MQHYVHIIITLCDDDETIRLGERNCVKWKTRHGSMYAIIVGRNIIKKRRQRVVVLQKKSVVYHLPEETSFLYNSATQRTLVSAKKLYIRSVVY